MIRQPSENGRLDEQQLRAVDALIRERLAGPLAVSDLAAVTGLSASCFARLFKAAMNRTPHSYILEMRIERAAELIRTGHGRSLAQIALECGFADQAHLTRVFRRVLGRTPAQYCREHGVMHR